MLEVSEEQVLYFRARRSHLAGPGAESTVAAVSDILGAQSQQLAPSLHAISLRTRGRPSTEKVKEQLLETRPRRLVRTWGQRDTVHVFSAEDWPSVVSARSEWAPGGRRGAMPDESLVDQAMTVLTAADGPLTRRDLFPILPASFVREVQAHPGVAEGTAKRFVAGRLFWRLVNRGDACMAGKIGAEQYYAARTAWFPDLEWPDPPMPPRKAASGLARRYLALHGPATANDIAHYFGARVSTARKWLEEIDGTAGLLPVACGGRDGLTALPEDEADLSAEPPPGASDWPVRLLPLWDTLLMGHSDKSWTVPDEAERRLVWRKSAYVAATVVARGRIVATWSHKARGGLLHVRVEPLGAWWASKHEAGVRREARSVAAHLGLKGAEISVAQ